jgi:hypothetical protein
MKDTTRLVLLGMVLEVVFALVGSVALFPARAEAQTGNNAVYDSGGNCTPCKNRRPSSMLAYLGVPARISVRC